MAGVVMAAVLLGTAGAAWAQEKPAPEKGAAEELLKEKGLSKTGAFMLLEDDAKLPEALRAFRLARKQYEDGTKKRLEFERQLKGAKGIMSQLEYENRNLNEQLGKVGKDDVFRHNQLIGQINAIASKMKEGEEYVRTREVEIKHLNESREAYINALLELSTKMDKAKATYDELAKDKDVAAAIAKVNEKAVPKVKLGPSAEMVQNLALVKRYRGDVASAVVKVNYEHRIPQVEVTLNGKVTKTMIVDSGASTVTVTSALAQQLGLEPKDADPVIQLRLADGKIVDARLMKLASVRVGQFTIEQVECAVLPSTLVAAEDLLGGSFLKHFVYKLDPEAGELHLNQVGKK